jgi:ABC-2 type transport system ATP-binding protein
MRAAARACYEIVVLRATSLTMRYSGVTALDGVSFEARPGEVLGFLGPNGAGKTTAMRICTGYLPASAGSVSVCGIDVGADSLRARARIGYLPESVPLYPEMRVHEYLGYRAALKNVARHERKKCIDEALAAVELTTERRRVIGQLSKGYRQRVGLADALVHRPDVLILDEPTDGLDPNQRRDVLALIARLGRERTVILSTHILPEVESVCARVVILDRGRVIAEGRPSELRRADRDLRVVFAGERDAVAAAIRAVDGVIDVAGEEGGDGEHALRVSCARDVREAIAAAVVALGRLRELRAAAVGLEAAFAALTGRAPDGAKPDGAKPDAAKPDGASPAGTKGRA